MVAVRVIVEVAYGVFVGTEAKVEHEDNTREISKINNKSLGLSLFCINPPGYGYDDSHAHLISFPTKLIRTNVTN